MEVRYSLAYIERYRGSAVTSKFEQAYISSMNGTPEYLKDNAQVFVDYEPSSHSIEFKPAEGPNDISGNDMYSGELNRMACLYQYVPSSYSESHHETYPPATYYYKDTYGKYHETTLEVCKRYTASKYSKETVKYKSIIDTYKESSATAKLFKNAIKPTFDMGSLTVEKITTPVSKK